MSRNSVGANGVRPNSALFSNLHSNPHSSLIAGVDEVGRGALFGPVVAAAVLLSPEGSIALQNLGVTDSKKLTAKRRETLRDRIAEIALDCQIGVATVEEIDRLNILQATLLAMKRAVESLTPTPTLCLIDGNRPVPDLAIPQRTVIGGDRLEIAIAAASIVAKVWRDAEIVRLAQDYPDYDLAKNKGYGTAKHRQALQTLGASPQHRRSFAPCQPLGRTPSKSKRSTQKQSTIENEPLLFDSLGKPRLTWETDAESNR
ncbi:ribonuclease HII [Baaleninema sp.]|uniref:ribonuclease HII n=1 Tax=Baaleninema sp. TaxID=3101197 RepID=UPI003D03AF3B